MVNNVGAKWKQSVVVVGWVNASLHTLQCLKLQELSFGTGYFLILGIKSVKVVSFEAFFRMSQLTKAKTQFCLHNVEDASKENHTAVCRKKRNMNSVANVSSFVQIFKILLFVLA